VGFVEGETCVTCDVDGTEEVSIQVEDTIDIKEEVSVNVEKAMDIKDEIPETVTFASIKTKHEVRLQGVFEVVAAQAFRPFIASKRKL
jgi:hypothetical protein